MPADVVYTFLRFDDKATIFNAYLSGHYVVFNNISTGHIHVTRILHEGRYIANAAVETEESGPCRAFVASVARVASV